MTTIASLPSLGNPPKNRSTVDTAKYVRKDLKATFPCTKFSVRTNSGWLFIHWIDGPTAEAVTEVTNNYNGKYIRWYAAAMTRPVVAHTVGPKAADGTTLETIVSAPHPSAALVTFNVERVSLEREISTDTLAASLQQIQQHRATDTLSEFLGSDAYGWWLYDDSFVARFYLSNKDLQ